MSVRTKNVIITTLLLLIMLGLLAWYLLAKPTPKLPSVATTTPSAVATAVTPDFSAPALHIIEHGQYYDADLQYPSATPLAKSSSPSADSAGVQTMKAFAQSTLATFKKDGQFDTLTPADAQIQGLDRGEKYALSDSYTPYKGLNTLSYVFNIYEDTLGAHPNTYFHTFTFDSATGQSLALSDLFVPDSDYLSQLSSLSRTALTAQEGSDAALEMLNPGTAPTADNFQNFAVDGTNLVLIFPPYQVAAYSLGTQTVRIPLAQLASILRSEFK